MAQRQTSGRGRRARFWVSEPGNLYASLAFRPSGASARLGDHAFVAGLTLHDAVTEICPGAARRVFLKWPNDLIAPEGKLSGILLEAESGSADAGPLLTIGWGVNCRHHPENGDYPAADLAGLGFDVPPERLFEALRGAFVHWSECLHSEGMAAIRTAWLSRARGVGKPIAVRLEDRTLHGVFHDLEADGRLVLAQADGTFMRIATGDVFFPDIEGTAAHG